MSRKPKNLVILCVRSVISPRISDVIFPKDFELFVSKSKLCSNVTETSSIILTSDMNNFISENWRKIFVNSRMHDVGIQILTPLNFSYNFVTYEFHYLAYQIEESHCITKESHDFGHPTEMTIPAIPLQAVCFSIIEQASASLIRGSNLFIAEVNNASQPGKGFPNCFHCFWAKVLSEGLLIFHGRFNWYLHTSLQDLYISTIISLTFTRTSFITFKASLNDSFNETNGDFIIFRIPPITFCNWSFCLKKIEIALKQKTNQRVFTWPQDIVLAVT